MHIAGWGFPAMSWGFDLPNLDSVLWIILAAALVLNLAVTLVLTRRWLRGRSAAPDGRTADQRLAMAIDGLESLDSGFALFDRDDRLVLCNETYRRANTLTADLLAPGTLRIDILRAAAQRGPGALSDAEADAWVEDELNRSRSSGLPFDRIHDDDRWYRVSEFATVGGGMVRTLTDITDVKRHEAALRHAQKIEAIGQLAGGLAHEFNNILTAVGGFAELARRRLEQPKVDRERIGKLLTEVVLGVRRGGNLTRQILTFSRRQAVETKVIEISESIDSVKGIIESLASNGIEVAFDLNCGTALVEVDPSQLEQAVINLALNARDAMPEGGKLTVACKTVSLDAGFVAAHKGSRPGAHAAISLSDSGMGMDATVISRIFEPFFTTKEDGNGTGLGLATTYGFVRQAGGIVTVESLPGKGSVFTLYLPIADAESKEDDGPLAPRGGAILVVDDEQTVRDFATLALEELGYEVHCAGGADEALATLAKAKGQIDVLLTDVMMPGLSGPELAGQVAQRHPDVTVIYMSGYENRRLAKERMVAKGETCLFKPFTQEMLDRAVRRALAARPRPERDDTSDQPEPPRKLGGMAG